MKKLCKDCASPTRPIAPKSGQRCATCWRAEKKARSERNHQRYVDRTYGEGWGNHYAKLKEFQGGRCAICQRGRGVSRRLAVDHDHLTGRVRGLCCKTCNFDLLGKYDIEALQRAIDYLTDPPAERYLRENGIEL